MKLIKILFCVVIVIGLKSCKEKKLIRKNVRNKDVGVTVYYYSYISNISPYNVELKELNTDSTVLVAKITQTVVDVEIRSDSIIISHTGRMVQSDYIIGGKVFDYNILIKQVDSHQLHMDYMKNKKDSSSNE